MDVGMVTVSPDRTVMHRAQYHWRAECYWVHTYRQEYTCMKILKCHNGQTPHCFPDILVFCLRGLTTDSQTSDAVRHAVFALHVLYMYRR